MHFEDNGINLHALWIYSILQCCHDLVSFAKFQNMSNSCFIGEFEVIHHFTFLEWEQAILTCLIIESSGGLQEEAYLLGVQGTPFKDPLNTMHKPAIWVWSLPSKVPGSFKGRLPVLTWDADPNDSQHVTPAPQTTWRRSHAQMASVQSACPMWRCEGWLSGPEIRGEIVVTFEWLGLLWLDVENPTINHPQNDHKWVVIIIPTW